MRYISVVAVVAVLQFYFFGVRVGLARGRYGVKAPAVSGHETFEREFRVHMNTLEQLVAFLPALFIAGLYWPDAVVAGVGAVYLLGRFVYWRQYVANPASRGPGFLLTVAPTFILLAAALVGALTRSAAG